MSSLKRSPLTSIENVDETAFSEGIELREVATPLLATNSEISHSTAQDNEIDETSPFPVDFDYGESETESRPNIENETNVRQRHRRRSPSLPRTTAHQNGGILQSARNFWADLLPSDNRNAWRIPILLFVIFIIFTVIVIIFVALGYATIDYDEFGVTHNTLTGIMNLKEPYTTGIHLILPWQRMIKFDKTARYLDFDDLAIFTTDQASVVLDATVVYRIRPDQIEPIWLNFASKHEQILRLVAENVLRNHGNQFSIYDYRARREHVETRLSRVLQQTLSGDCCPICCQEQTCSKTIVYSCSLLTHCKNSLQNCSNGYFVHIDAVYIFKVDLPQPIIQRLYTLMLKPIFTEIAESQETAAIVWIETERQRNELLNKARQILMNALASSELVQEKARIVLDNLLLKETSSSERQLFDRLNIQTIADKFSAAFLLELNHLANLSKTIDVDNLVAQCDGNKKTQQTSDLFDFVPASNVFDLTEFLSILEN